MDERYVFIVEWFDTSASLIRTYNLTYYMSDKTIEMVHNVMTVIVRFEKQTNLSETVRVPLGSTEGFVHRKCGDCVLTPIEDCGLC